MPLPMGHSIHQSLAAVTLATAYDEQAGASAGALASSFLTLAADAALTSERVLTPGTGMTGSDAGAGSTYTLGVNQGYSFAWTNTQSWAALAMFNAGLRVAAGQALQFGSDVQLDRKSADTLELGTGDNFQSPGYSGGTVGWKIDASGNAEFNSITARGELRASTFVIQEIHAMGGSMVILPAAELYAQVTTA
jgi:hypothetical protein